MTPLAQEISINSGKFAQEIADAHPDISTRELESIIAGSVMTQLAEIRLRRAMNKRKAERSLRKVDMKQQKKEDTYQDSILELMEEHSCSEEEAIKMFWEYQPPRGL